VQLVKGQTIKKPYGTVIAEEGQVLLLCMLTNSSLKSMPDKVTSAARSTIPEIFCHEDNEPNSHDVNPWPVDNGDLVIQLSNQERDKLIHTTFLREALRVKSNTKEVKGDLEITSPTKRKYRATGRPVKA
jgi:hypothetical protein